MEIRKRKVRVYFVLSVLIILCLCIGIFTPDIAKNNDALLSIQPTSAQLNTTYGALYHGSTYRYTDYTKVEAMHNGAISDDTTLVVVDSNQPHGSQKNPYVIDTTARWNAFAADMDDTSSGITDYGKDDYFVIACDLDFNGTVFEPASYFSGTIYGLGNTIANITYDGNKGYMGLIRATTGKVTIADLNLTNYYYFNTSAAGGIVGRNIATTSERSEIRFLNCHTQGEISRQQNAADCKLGGLAGHIASEQVNSLLVIYRCSSKLYSSIEDANLTYDAAISPFVAQVRESIETVILDSYGEMKLDVVAINKNGFYAAILPYVNNLTQPVRLENCVGNIRVNGCQNSEVARGAHTVIAMTNNTSSKIVKNVSIKNVYVKGEAEQSGTVYNIYPHCTTSTANTYFGNPTFIASNVEYAGNGSSMLPLNSGFISNTKLNDKSTKVSVSQLWSNAKANTDFKPDVWTGMSNIGDTYVYSVADSPVRNKVFDSDDITVKFRHLKLSGGTLNEESIGVNDETYNYADGSTLPTPSAPDSNHSFVGWTTDTTGETTPFKSLPANMYGDITLYAVWDNPNATASVTLANSATGDSTNTIEYGTGDITLTATSNGVGMTSPTKTFAWYKDSGTSVVGTGNTCVLSKVKESGDYYLEYTLKDSVEPLWRHKEKMSTPQKVTINKGKLSVKSFDIDVSTPAYYGMKLSGAQFNIQVEDSGSNSVAYSTVRWQSPNNIIAEGLNDNIPIVFTPQDTDNYEQTTLFVNFNSAYITLTYDMDSEIAGEKIVINLQYEQPFSANKTIETFLSEFRKRLEDDDYEFQSDYKTLENMTPQFNNVDISQYNTNLPDVTAPQKIVVTFVDKNYTVTFKTDDTSVVATDTRKFNQLLNPIANPTKEEHIFRGWNFTEKDDLGNDTTRHWNFDEDRVKGDMTLVADWFKANLTLQSIEVKPKAGYEALTQLSDGDIEVIAHYTTDSPDVPTYDQKLTLDPVNGYKITYSSNDNRLHVNSNGITVNYTYNGVTKTARVTLNVTPKSLDSIMAESGITFENKTVKYDGSAKEIGEVKGDLPVQIIEVKYEYWIGGVLKDKSEIIEIGQYTVIAKFISSDPDYTASDMEATLTISRTGGGTDTDPDDPNNSDNNGNDEDNKGGAVDFEKIGQVLKEWWQVIASVVSIVLIIIFTSKGISYAGKRKENKKATEKYSAFYVISGVGLFNWSMKNWTIIASVLMGAAVLSFVFMLIEKRGYKKSQRALEDAKEEYARNREESMYMRMMGGNGNMNGGQSYAYQPQPALGAEEMRLMINEAVTALLPGVQQMLPQQASSNDELVNKLIEQNEKLVEQNDKNEERIEKLIKQLADKKSTKEVASASISDEAIEKLANKLQPATIDEKTLKIITQNGSANDETIKRILDNQDKLMQKILELSANQPVEKEVVEKIVEVPVEKIVEKEVIKEVPVEVEKIVEKEVPVEVEKIVEKVVEVPVEKIVEKEVVKEVPIEVEKVVEKIVEIPSAKPAPKAKTTAPRLTLDEAYEKLSAKQKKIFDTLKEYAMSKDKCKEKKSTYYILFGQSSVNPLVKLTIKKDTTVALFKMEDEYMKDIRRNATSDGTKVKVKETELVVGDSQALATAKEMIDLREDQIERYNDYLKEQRSMKKR